MMRGSIPMLALAVLLPAAVQARPSWISGTYVYADLCTQPQTGGLAGRRITLRRSPNGDDLVFETASGTAATALRAGEVGIDDATKQVAFSVDTDSGPVRFRGTAAVDGLAGTLSDQTGEHPLNLRRVLRSRAHEACRPAQGSPGTATSH